VSDIGRPERREGPGFRSWVRGTPGGERVHRVGGAMLEGGAEDVDDAWRWFLERAGYGDVVVLRATPDEGYDAWLPTLASFRSFQTLQLTDRAAAEDPFVLRSIEGADGLFIAGGDQSAYVRVWDGTGVQRAVNTAIAAGVPMGGISAGLAVLGGFAFTAERDTVTSEEALADPFGDRVRLARGFLTVPGLEATITDSHFSERERLGRLLAFMARTLADGWSDDVRGIGIDEATAVLIEPGGTATVTGAGAAWFLRMQADDVDVWTAGEPLSTRPIQAVAVRARSTFDLPSWAGHGDRVEVAAVDGSVRLGVVRDPVDD
jgi:cyanophycinase